MGYVAKSYEHDMFFPAEVLKDALSSLQAKASEHTNNGWSEDICQAKSLKDALELLYFNLITHKDGSLTVDNRAEDKVPMHMNDYFQALAPFVHRSPARSLDGSSAGEGQKLVQGGYIVWIGEDGDIWRDSFEDGEHRSERGRLVPVFD